MDFPSNVIINNLKVGVRSKTWILKKIQLENTGKTEGNECRSVVGELHFLKNKSLKENMSLHILQQTAFTKQLLPLSSVTGHSAGF